MTAGIKDTGWPAFILDLTREKSVTVGFHEKDNKRKEKVTNAAVASFNEFGLGVPRRSFVRPTFDRNVSLYEKYMMRIFKGAIMRKMDIRQGFKVFGLKVTKDLKKTIRSNVPPANAASTLRRKRASGRFSSPSAKKKSVKKPENTRVKTPGKAPPKKSTTKKRTGKQPKMSSRTLIDTAQMLNAVDFEVKA